MNRDKVRHAVFDDPTGNLSDIRPIWDEIQKDKPAKKALDQLVASGCVVEFLLSDLYLYAGGDPRERKKALKDFKSLARQVPQLAEMLESAAKLFESVHPRLCEALSGTLNSQITNLPFGMREYARWASKMARSIKAGASPINWRTKHLVALALHVQVATGADPNYGDIARLVGCIQERYSPSLKIRTDAESLRKRVRRFKSREPAYNDILGEQEQAFHKLQETHARHNSSN